MGRHDNARVKMLATKARRQYAIERNEIRGPTEPRVAPASATSAMMKAEDPDLRRMIDEALAMRRR